MWRRERGVSGFPGLARDEVAEVAAEFIDASKAEETSEDHPSGIADHDPDDTMYPANE